MPTFSIAAANEDGNSQDTDEYIDPANGPFGGAYLGSFSSTLLDWAGIYRSTGIPQGATILTAFVSVPLVGGDFSGTPTGAWWGFNVDTPTDFNSADVHRISDHHARTTATVTDTFTNTNPYVSVSIVAIVQEIVDRAGFGGDLGITFRAISPGGDDDWFATGAFETGNAATLTVTWDAGGGGGSVTSPYYFVRRRRAA